MYRLENRKMKDEFQEIFTLKTQLWNERLQLAKTRIFRKWTISDIDKVIKTLKKNQTTDPNGLINEIFMEKTMGLDLKKGLLNLMNGIKENMQFPEQILFANISSIFKQKGSRFELNSERGIFILSIFRKTLDKLIYQEKYPFIDSAMSDSNIGSRKDRNIKNHLFILYGIINSVLKEENSCIDIQIYDLVQCFDGLCMNDMFESLPSEQQDDKLALIYESNVKNLVAVKTPVGQTETVNINKIVTQGGTDIRTH